MLHPPDGESADGEVVRAALALRAVGLADDVAVVAEMKDPHWARVLGQVTHGRVVTVVSTEVIARIAAQICRYSGLSHVFQELLDFDGDEIYFQEERLAGEEPGTAVLSYERSSVIGLRRRDGRVLVCPPARHHHRRGRRRHRDLR